MTIEAKSRDDVNLNGFLLDMVAHFNVNQTSLNLLKTSLYKNKTGYTGEVDISIITDAYDSTNSKMNYTSFKKLIDISAKLLLSIQNNCSVLRRRDSIIITKPFNG